VSGPVGVGADEEELFGAHEAPDHFAPTGSAHTLVGRPRQGRQRAGIGHRSGQGRREGS